MDSLSLVIFMMLWLVTWFLLAFIALWLILVIVAFITTDRSYINRFYKAMKE